MDFDAKSNISQISNQSDDVKSTISSISGLSGYQDELAELKHLVNPDKYLFISNVNRDQCSTPVNDSGCDVHYEDRIADLSHQLQKTLKQNEHYKNELFHLEMKYEVKYNEKIEKLIKSNNKLEIELLNANQQIQRLIKNYPSKTESKFEDVNSFINLEKRCHELTLKTSDLERKCAELGKYKRELDQLNKKIKIDLNDSKLEVETKSICIKQLKEKFSQQFVELQMLTKEKNVASQLLYERNLEIEQLLKSLDWHKIQLEILQKEKKVLCENLSKCRIELLSKTEEVDALTLEIKSRDNKFELHLLEVLQEKEKLYQDLQRTLFKEQKIPIEGQTATLVIKSDESMLHFYENCIGDLKKEILYVKNLMKDQDEILKNLIKENADLVSKCVTSHKLLENKNVELEDINLIKHELLNKLDTLKDSLFRKENEIEILRNEKVQFETALLSCREEKEFVDIAINTIRDQLAAFTNQYKSIKEELLEKNQQILIFQNEKQQLFMNNNWKICELEESKAKDVKIKKLMEDLCNKEEMISQYNMQLNILKGDFRNKDKMIQRMKNDHDAEVNRYDNVLVEFKNMVEGYEFKIKTLEDTLVATKDLKDNLNILKSELKKRDIETSKLRIDNEKLMCQLQEVNVKNYLDKGTNTEAELNKHSINDNSSLQIIQPAYKCNTKILYIKVDKLKRRVINLESSILNCKKKVNTIEIEKCVMEKSKSELNALLQVKELELNEKQKKYERNYRTLFRKVREHMKGRNIAEKHSKYLQELYNNISDENSTLKLSLTCKDNETEDNRKLLKDFMKNNSIMKKEILELEKKLKIQDICTKCIEFDIIKEKVNNLEMLVTDLTNEKQMFKDLVTEKDNFITNLQQRVQELMSQLYLLEAENKSLVLNHEGQQLMLKDVHIKNELLSKQMKENDLKLQQFHTILKDNDQSITENCKEIFALKHELRDVKGRLDISMQEKEILNSSLQLHIEEFEFLKNEYDNKEDFLKKQCENHTKTIKELKTHLQIAYKELSSFNSDRFFNQRICNDLKVALKSQHNQNQVLKEKLDILSHNRDSFNSTSSLPELNIPYLDETFIHNLLKESRASPTSQPFSDIHTSLETLKKEIFILQKQIMKKNCEE